MIELTTLVIIIAITGAAMSAIDRHFRRSTTPWYQRHEAWKRAARFEARENADQFARNLFGGHEP